MGHCLELSAILTVLVWSLHLYESYSPEARPQSVGHSSDQCSLVGCFLQEQRQQLQLSKQETAKPSIVVFPVAPLWYKSSAVQSKAWGGADLMKGQ